MNARHKLVSITTHWETIDDELESAATQHGHADLSRRTFPYSLGALALAACGGFVHPGLLHTQADFDRKVLKYNTQPRKGSWDKLIANSHAQLGYVPQPQAIVYRGYDGVHPENYVRLFNDVAAAYACALRWKISGDSAYADKAVQMMNAWSSTLTCISGTTDAQLAPASTATSSPTPAKSDRLLHHRHRQSSALLGAGLQPIREPQGPGRALLQTVRAAAPTPRWPATSPACSATPTAAWPPAATTTSSPQHAGRHHRAVEQGARHHRLAWAPPPGTGSDARDIPTRTATEKSTISVSTGARSAPRRWLR